MTNDMINGLFEFTGSIFLFRNCLMLYRDKTVKGVSVWSTIYFFAWGVWNLFFYPSLNQYWSFAGGIAIMVANSLWISMMIYYIQKNKKPVYECTRCGLTHIPGNPPPYCENGPCPMAIK